MSVTEGKDLRRQPRFDFGGTAMLVFDDVQKRRTLAITNYRNISKGGACIITPDSQSFTVGDHLFLMPERYRKRRDLLLNVLQRKAGRHARGLMPRSIPAGLQAVVRLPAEQPVIRRAAAAGLAIEGLADNYHGDDVHQGIVIGFGRPSDSAYRPALEALAASLP